MKIAFRTDSSSKIGSGHLMRCLALAKQLKKYQHEVLFITRSHENNFNKILFENKMDVVLLNKKKAIYKSNNKYDNWLSVSQEEDAEDTVISLGSMKPDWLIVDHYSINITWEKIIRPYVKCIMVIDDLANRKHDCDLILDQNWFGDNTSRYKNLVSKTCVSLFGPKYALLRPEFNQSRQLINNQQSIFNNH